MINKFKKGFFDIEINGYKFRLIKSKFNQKINSFYYYSEFENLENFKILNVAMKKKVSIGLSFFIINDNKIGICLFANHEKKDKDFVLETIVKTNPNLKVQYHFMKNLKEKDSLVLNCFLYEIGEIKGDVNVKILFK